MSEVPAYTELANRFEAAARTRRGRAPVGQRPVVLVAGALALAALAFLAGVVSRPDRVVAGAPLTMLNGKLVISYQQVRDDPEAVEAQIASAGLHIKIREMPATPSLVGAIRWGGGMSPIGDESVENPVERWMVESCDDPQVCDPWWANNAEADATPDAYEAGILVPLDLDASTEIHVGRPVRPDDESTELTAAPWAPGEALACRNILLRTVADVREMVADVDIPLQWSVHNAALRPDEKSRVDPDGNYFIEPEHLDAANTWTVVTARYALAASVVSVDVERPIRAEDKTYRAALAAEANYHWHAWARDC